AAVVVAGLQLKRPDEGERGRVVDEDHRAAQGVQPAVEADVEVDEVRAAGKAGDAAGGGVEANDAVGVAVHRHVGGENVVLELAQAAETGVVDRVPTREGLLRPGAGCVPGQGRVERAVVDEDLTAGVGDHITGDIGAAGRSRDVDGTHLTAAGSVF